MVEPAALGQEVVGLIPAPYWLSHCQYNITSLDRNYDVLAPSVCGSLGTWREIAQLLTRTLRKHENE